MKHLIILLVIMALVFSGYSLITNLAMSSMYKNSLQGRTTSQESFTY